MDLNEATLLDLSATLSQTLSPDRAVRTQAESNLHSLANQRGFPLVLLSLLDKDQVELQVRVAGAIHFKNLIKATWKVTEDSDDKIHAEDRDRIKQLIVDMMLKSPPHIQKQLSNAIAIIGQQDFPMKWPELLQNMVQKFASGDFHLINGVLQTAASIFEKYSFEMKSQKLWEEIKFVLDNFAQPFTDLMNATMGLAKQHAANPDALKVIFGSLVQIAKIFYYLNYQDLPEFFEDNITVWMNHFHELLTSDNKILKTEDEEEPGLLEELKSQICDNIGLYAHKYEEEFSPFMQQFVTAVWNLLLTVGPQVKYDLLASNAIQFLASVADRQQYKSLFEDRNVLSSICEKVIVPNIEMRDIDVEQFEDNAEEYIRRDLEGSDVDTRRRAACDLVKGLSRYFESQITEIFGAYVKTMLEMYATNPAQKWRSKDAAIYLVTSLATRAKTAKHGITQTNQLVDLSDFCLKYIIPDLQSQNVNELPVIKADAIKYVMTFRSQLPPETIKACLPLLIPFLRAESHVVHTYAAAAVDKILIMKKPGLQDALVSSQDLAPLAEQLLTGLFGAFSLPGSTENEYVMKCVMRSFSTLKESVIPYLASLLPVLTQKLQLAAKNPTRPHYNHYLFESLGLSIRIVCKTQPQAVANFESVLFPVFQEILQQDVQEFVPYVFQILSLLLELHTDSVPQPYMELFQFLLMPVLWDRPGNVTPLVRLIQAYISRGPQQIINLDKVEALLGVFQKLIASKSNDHEGFYLVQSLVEHFPEQIMDKYLTSIFRLLFQRLTSSKTTKFVKSFLVFMFLVAIKYGGSKLIQTIDSIQAQMFSMVCERLIILEIQKVSGSTEKKICAVGLTKLLCDTPEMTQGSYANFWTPILQALVGLFELPEDETIPDDEHFIEIEDTPGYQTAYSQLVFVGKRNHDPLAGVADPRVNLAQSLHKMSVARPGMIGPLVAQMNPQAQQFLQKYLQAANVNLS
ncbi:exportin-2-like [Tigriopus californicus]|uniref:exportin-2-like n=1 Tax=Tigriopus californicus TaxID=6832 RepID=UPI0027DAB112|nr:exportin-2-like [Tigriopus californicus]